MWRYPFAVLRKAIIPTLRQEPCRKFGSYQGNRGRSAKPIGRVALFGAGFGVVLGASYGGYTHYVVNTRRTQMPMIHEDYVFLRKLPEYKAQCQVVSDSDDSGLKLILFQFRTCPFCCKVRSFLDARGISYEVVEVDAVLRHSLKWSGYKKVPIVLAKVDGGYQQLLESSAIISILETYLRERDLKLTDIITFYPATRQSSKKGIEVKDVANKYFVMSSTPGSISEEQKDADVDEREWRKWADRTLVHTLSPNVYRTLAESVESFWWFQEAGRWKETFPAWECALMVYVGSVAMYFVAKRLKKKHHIRKNARNSLYDAGNEWVNAVKTKGRFHGGNEPDLADISVFGVLSSIEGCRAFQDLRENTDVGRWYDDMKDNIDSKRGKIIMNKA